MNVGEIIILFEMGKWQRFLFWAVNVPRYLLGMELVVWKCMIGCKVVPGFRKATMKIDGDE